MYAIIATGGKQYKVSEGDVISVEKLDVEVNGTVTFDDVLAVSGNISYKKIIDILVSCLNKEDTKAISIMDSILKEGKEVPRFINDVVLFLRDLLLYKNNDYKLLSLYLTPFMYITSSFE